MGKTGLNIEVRADSLGSALEDAHYAHERLLRLRRYMKKRKLASGSQGKFHNLQLCVLFAVAVVWIAPLPLAALSDFLDMGVYQKLGTLMIAAQLTVTVIFLDKRDWLRTGRWGAALRFSPAIAWGFLVGLYPEFVGVNRGALSKFGAFGALIVCLVTIAAALIWIAPIRPPHSENESSSTSEDDPDWSGLDKAVLNYDQTLRSSRVERRINTFASVTFTVLTAIILNLFSLIGSLAHPLIFLIIIAVFSWTLLMGWKSALDQRRRSGLQFSGALGAQAALLFILVTGMITFLSSAAIDVLEYESWIDRMKTDGDEVVDLDFLKAVGDGFNRRDWSIFLVQTVVLVLATGVPIWASRMYADKTAVSLRRESVLYSVRGKRIFNINQATCVIESCRETRFLWPRTIWLPITVVRSGEDDVFVHMKWRAQGFRKNSRYVYRYSEIQYGDDFSIIGATHRWTYWFAKARSCFSGRNLVPWSQSVVNVVEPNPAQEAEGQFPYLSLHGVPPYVPRTILPFPQ